MTEREDIRRAMFDALRVEDHPFLTDVMPTDVWRLWSAAWNAAKLYGAEEQKNAMIADGWRQCAQGQGASQFCEQAEANRQEIERLTWTIEAAQAIWNTREKVLLEAWDDLLEDMELHGMHDFEPYKKSKEAFLRMKQK